MKQILTFFLCLFFSRASAQEKVELESIKNYNGKLVEVRGKVAKISLVGKGKGQHIEVLIEGDSPDEKLSIMLSISGKGESHYLLKDNRFSRGFVLVTGVVAVVKGKATIKLENDETLRFIIDEEV